MFVEPAHDVFIMPAPQLTSTNLWGVDGIRRSRDSKQILLPERAGSQGRWG